MKEVALGFHKAMFIICWKWSRCLFRENCDIMQRKVPEIPYTCQLADARANEISPELYKLYYLHRSNQIVKNLTAYKNDHAIVWVLLLEFGA